MISRDKFEFIKKKYGHYASWAVWADEGLKPKDNIGDLSIFDIEKNVSLLSQLNPNIVLVGLNISRPIETPFANFHDARPQAMDYKIRYAFQSSPYWGAYMTDVIKDFEQKACGKMMSYLRKNKGFEEENIKLFRDELYNIGSDNTKLVAFGKDAYLFLDRHFKNEFQIFKIPHYSNYTSKEKYRDEVKSILGFE
jgi:hypothetical protein